MDKILVLGCGLIGKTIAKDLAESYSVFVADINDTALAEISNISNIQTLKIDLSRENNLKELIKDFTFVVSAVPGFMGFNTLKTLIEMGKKVVDISFFPESPFTLQDVAQANNSTAVVDCGIAPGFSNMVVGYYYQLMKVERVLILVGGLPFARYLPFEYKAPFSPIDVLEEYLRPARYKHSGKIFEKPALSEVELLDFEGIGTLEAFLTDGVRTLLVTLDIPNIKEKTLRYPGYAEKIAFLRECGFLSSTPIEFPNGKVSPLEVTSKLLLPKWKLAPNEQEFTLLKVFVEGYRNTIPLKVEYQVFDRTDNVEQNTSMSRTTGYTATAVMNLLIRNKINTNGIITPEEIAFDKANFKFVVEYLKNRKITIQRKEIVDGKLV
ncbi:MAG: saccharopine dehydrogenase family protein [Candidatus Kapaibacteriales bacterium]